MSKNGTNNLCPLTDEIVAYIYGEIGGNAELDFETHLTDCTACTDEFAAVSDARFSVYEWKKEAFDPLPTPDITIPYRESASLPWPPTTWIAAVKAWAGSLRMPVAVAAGVAIFVGVGILAFTYLSRPKVQVANVTIPAANTPDKRVPDVVKASDPVEPRQAVPSVAPIKASSSRPQRTIKRMHTNPSPPNNFVPSRTTRAEKAPALTSDQESEDNSLRLADLFDEVGG